MFDSIHEECGVFGVFNVENAYPIVCKGLMSLQHRGQEACGIVSFPENEKPCHRKGMGLVSDVLEKDPASLPGKSAIGHVRYSTSGGSSSDNIQPFFFYAGGSDFAMAHNGDIINSRIMRRKLEEQGDIFHSTSDSEVVAHLIGMGGRGGKALGIQSLSRALNQLDGSFSLLLMDDECLYACRDKYGFRPLSIGRLADGYVVCSETCALTAVRATFVRDVKPGEIVCINKNGLTSHMYTDKVRNALCAMEYIYFARPDSNLEGVNVHSFRKEAGKILFKEHPVDADIVIGVPDSGMSAAMGYAEASRLPLEIGLVKNNYVGRTFIKPKQEMRERGVSIKLSPVKQVLEGKRVIVIDDSIVRGTTSLKIVRMLKYAGASEVHMMISSPMIKYPCFYGIDISTSEELLCSNNDLDAACKAIEADSLSFLSEAGLLEAGQRSDLCMGCFNRKYPTELYDAFER